MARAPQTLTVLRDLSSLATICLVASSSPCLRSHKAIYSDNTVSVAVVLQWYHLGNVCKSCHFRWIFYSGGIVWRIRGRARTNKLQSAMSCLLITPDEEIRGGGGKKRSRHGSWVTHGHNYTYIYELLIALCAPSCECAAAILQCCGCLPSS